MSVPHTKQVGDHTVAGCIETSKTESKGTNNYRTNVAINNVTMQLRKCNDVVPQLLT